MARRKIVQVGDPILRKVCKPVEKFDGKLAELIDDMIQTLDYAEGLGLAAPQVGILRRVCIVEYDDKRYELVNPTIVHASGKCVDNEGCLSVPGYRGLWNVRKSLTSSTSTATVNRRKSMPKDTLQGYSCTKWITLTEFCFATR